MTQVVTPINQFSDVDGNPLESGYIYIGAQNLDPVANPIAVYWDADLTITASQPIRTLGGYPSRSGAASVIYVSPSAYSIKITNKNGSTLFTELSVEAPNSASGVSFAPAGTIAATDVQTAIEEVSTGAATATALVVSNLALSSGSSLVGFIQSSTGAVARTEQDKSRDILSIKDNGILGTGLVDCSASFNLLATYAESNGYQAIYAPAGTYLLNSTVNLGRLKLIGDGEGTIFKPGMSDGSAVLSVTAGTNFFQLKDFVIDSGINLAQFLAGTISGQNCTGIKIVSSGSTYSARYVLRDVRVRGCKVGYDVNGFIGTFDNVWATVCETGLIGTAMNSCRLHMRFEECRKSFAVTSSNGIHFDQLMDEGGVLNSGLVSSTIDGCNGVVFTAPYYEQVRNSPFMVVGGTTECKSVTVHGCSMAMSDNASSNYDIYPLAFDRVNGLHITGYFSTGSHTNCYSTTSNTKNIIDESIPSAATTSFFAPHDASKNLSVVRNHFPNPSFDMWLRGWPDISVVRATISRETSIIRRGMNALRLTYNAAQTATGNVNFRFNDGYLATKFQGKTLSFYVWVWVPNDTWFNPSLGASQTVQLYCQLTYDGTGGTTIASSTANTTRNAWNLFKVTASIPSDCTTIQAAMVMAMFTGSSTGAETIVIDSCYLVEGDGQDIHIRNGWIADSDNNPCYGIGGLAIIRGDAVPSDVDQAYEVGDQILKRTVAAAGSPGWVCTTAGAGGTAVFKAMAAVAA